MSRKDYVRPEYLDLGNEGIIHALIALDTELNTLHRLCMEQGPFFKSVFEEMSSDALRKGLHWKMPGQQGFVLPANQSHSERGYWKPEIKLTQIETIQSTVTNFSYRWEKVYEMYQRDRFYPKAYEHTQSPVTQLDLEFTDLTRNIIAICKYLTTPHDISTTYTPTKKDRVDAEENRKKSNLLDQLKACMDWVELNYDDVQEQRQINGTHHTLLQKICGPIAELSDFRNVPSWHTENLNLVRKFEIDMQKIIDKQPQKDTALLRRGNQLLRNLSQQILEFQKKQPTVEATPQITEITSALSSLLARLTKDA